MNLEVLVNLPLDDQDFDFPAISSNSDYIILMAYDQNTPYERGLSGPIASQSWFSDALKIKTTQLPKNKIILSLGSYGYDWPDISSPDYIGRDLTFFEAMNLASEKKTTVKLDETSLNPRFEYQADDGTKRSVWFLDGATVYNQAKAANSLGIFNFAVWRMGSEDPTIWQIFPNLSKPHKEIGEIISNIDFRDSIQNIGDGEILKVIDVPTAGKRKLTIDASKNLIISESYETFPSPFVVQRWGASDKKLAITFDDGPDSNYTNNILDTLKQNDIKATFFIIGANASKNQDLIKRMDREGHEIGSHTFSHPNILNISQKQLLLELNLVENMLGSIIKKNTLLFRPPYAEDSEPQTPDHIGPLLELSSLGYYTVAMHLDPLDWSRPGTGEIVDRVTKDLDSQSGNILLLHDGGGNRDETVEALPEIIAKVKERSYEFVTVSDLMGLAKDDVMPQIPAKEKLASNFSWVVFVSSDIFMSFFESFFFIGIALGLARFGFIGILAIIQKIKSVRKTKLFSNNSYAPSVGVVIPAYNEEKVILRTVRSILNSDYPDLNIIIVDDGSTDNTYQFLINAFSENKKVSILTQENSGKAEALNLGIAFCQSEIIITLDADTIFRKDTISKLVRHFENLKIGAVAGNAKVGNRMNILTYWQALEYITNQNLDRRAFDLLNCIIVVPGSVGAWRKKAVVESNGFQDRTLAEDSDLTFFIIRNGYKVTYEDNAIAYTEAPDNVKNFIKQRFRWMYGTFQSAWLHKRALLEKKSRFLGIVGIPNIFIFQVIFPLLSPIVDAALIVSLLWIGWQKYQHPLDFNAMYSFKRVFIFYALFLIIDFLTSSIAFLLEKKEDWSLLFWIFPQRFFYRQLMYFVAIKVFIGVLKGSIVGWGKFDRKASVRIRTVSQEEIG